MNQHTVLKRFSRTLAPVAVAAALAACAHSPQNAASHLGNWQMPAQWLEQNQNAQNKENIQNTENASIDIQTWWQHFGDAQLNALIARAFENNASFAATAQALAQARAQSDASGAALLPSVGASAGAARSRSGNADARNRYSAGLDASWELDLWGRKGSAVDAAWASALAAEASLADARRTLAADVALAYVQLRSLAQRLHIARASVAMLEQTAQIVQWRATSGLASSLEVEQSRQSLEQQRAQIPTLEASHAQAVHQLATLLGDSAQTVAEQFATAPKQPLTEKSPSKTPSNTSLNTLSNAQTPSTKNPVLSRGSGGSASPSWTQTLADMRSAIERLPAIPQSTPAMAAALASTPLHTIERRPDVRVRVHRVEAAMANLRAQEVANWPTLRLSASWTSGAATLAALSQGASIGASLAASFAATLFDGGANAAQIRAQSAALEQARQNLRAAVLAALQEVEDALVQRTADAQRIEHLRAAQAAAHNAALLAMQRYESGIVDFQTVLETQRSLLSAQDTLAQATASLTSDDVRLYKALGGGWDFQAENKENAQNAENLIYFENPAEKITEKSQQ